MINTGSIISFIVLKLCLGSISLFAHVQYKGINITMSYNTPSIEQTSEANGALIFSIDI